MKGKVCIVAVALLAASAALGGIVSVGDPIEGGSWTVRFQEDGNYGPHYNVDFFGVQMISAGDSFENPALSAFSVAWTLQYQNQLPYPTIASAGGVAVGYLQWTFQFAGATSNPLIFDYAAFAGDTLLGVTRITWNGSAFSYEWPGPVTYERADFIPAPAAVVLGAIGLGLVGWVKRRLS